MRIFLTGHKGYIGSHLSELLKKEEGYEVTGCDLGLFAGCEFEPFIQLDIELTKDFRDATVNDLKGFDAVIHLAAISNDPMGDIDEGLTYAINMEGSINLAKIAKKAGIPRFLFAGSCSVYGKGKNLSLDENNTLRPLSAYAISKVNAEKGISKLADKDFTPVFLRNATAYGFSPMLRIDLVVNNLLACAFTSGEIRIMSDGTPWRPLIHCKDIARAFIAFLKAPKENIHNKAINIGADSENYQVKDVADKVKELIPDANIVYTGEVGEDPRNYRVSFNLLTEILPDFRLEYNLKKGMEELHEKFKAHRFSLSDFHGDRYMRLKTLKKRINQFK